MRIMATHVCLSFAVAIFAALSGLALAYGMPAIAGVTAVLSLVLMTGGAVILYDALKAATGAARVWQSRWGAEVGSAPRLLRSLLVSMERGLHVRPSRGASMEERTENVLDALAEQRSSITSRSQAQSVRESTLH
jgi:hypothetical protein